MTYETPLADLAQGVAIDEDRANGTADAAFARTPAWHTLGTVTPGLMSVEQGLELALNWEVEQVPITVPYITSTGVTTLETRNKANVRVNPFTQQPEVLGVVGPTVGNLSHKELGDWGHDIIGEQNGSRLASLGAFDGGRKVFMSLELPQGIKVGGEDAVGLYLSLLDFHDGMGSLTGVITAIRSECRNTVAAGIGTAQTRIKIRHTSGMRDRMAEARHLLGVSVKYIEEFEQIGNALLAKKTTNQIFEDMVKNVFGDKPTGTSTGQKRAITQWENRFELLQTIKMSDAEAFGRNTAYGDWNTVTDYLNFGRPVRLPKGASDSEKQIARAEAIVMGDTDNVAKKALRFLQKV